MPQEKSTLSLTHATEVSRKALIVGSLTLVTFLVLWFAAGAFIRFWIATHPEPPPPPTVGFGVLPAPIFPENIDADMPKKYVLETPNGRLPSFPDRANVFFMPKNAPGLLDAQKAAGFAAKYDFVFEPEILDSRTYRWQKTQPFLITLQYDIQDYVFSYTSDFLSKPELLVDAELPTRFDAISEVKRFLQKGVELAPDVATAAGEFSFVKSVGSEFLPAVSITDADFVTVDINRVPVDGQYIVYTDKYGKGIIHALVGNIASAEKVLLLDYYYYPIDRTVIHSYPLRPIRQAWDLVQGGEAYIAHPTDGEQATIRSVTLGYYDSSQPQMYFQPIYVFAGDDEFLAFVPAIDPQYLTQVSDPQL